MREPGLAVEFILELRCDFMIFFSAQNNIARLRGDETEK
jgi:hypothetical protein